MKFNRFHWHLTDDQGWRIEVKQYPKLTEIGAWRDSTIFGHYNRVPRSYDKTRHGGFYTQEQAKELVRYAAARGITIVPEIELPGHARAALAAYPELGCTGEYQPVPGLWGVFDDVFCTKPETIVFLKNVLDEVTAIFPSETIHIGGDEVPKVRWDVCPDCKKMREQHGLKDSHELQSYVIREMEQHLRSKGKKLMGWDEILEGGLADNAQVMSWRGTEGGIAAAKQHHPVVMTPTNYCYFDYYQSSYPGEPLAIGGYLPLEKVYAFDPVPKELDAGDRQYILGGQANLWTEYLPTMRDVQYNAFPRLIAMSQVLWTKQLPSYDEMVTALSKYYLPRLEKNGIHYSKAFLDPQFTPFPLENGVGYHFITPVKGVNISWNGTILGDLNLLQTSIPQTFDAELYITGEGVSVRKIILPFTTHRFLGKPIVFDTPPHPKYNHHGALALTDGIRGVRPWKGSQWLGFMEDTVRFSIDLGKKERFSVLELGCLDAVGSWIHLPKTIIVETSADGNHFKEWKRMDVTAETIKITETGKARYLRITLINNEFIPSGNEGAGTTPWTFIDELIIH